MDHTRLRSDTLSRGLAQEPRLDERGYHLTSVTRTAWSRARWNCETTTSEEETGTWVDGDAIEVYDPEDEGQLLKLRVGDCAYMKGKAKGKPAEIVKIVDLCADKDGDIWIGCKYFWRPEKMRLPRDLDWHPKELFIQHERNKAENWVGLVEFVPVVCTELHDPSALVDPPPPHTYFYRRTFDPSTLDLKDISPTAAAAPAPAASETQQPMDIEGSPTQPATQPKPPRRNENKERLAALEAQVERLSARAELVEPLIAQVAELRSQNETMSTKLAQLGALAARVASLESGL